MKTKYNNSGVFCNMLLIINFYKNIRYNYFQNIWFFAIFEWNVGLIKLTSIKKDIVKVQFNNQAYENNRFINWCKRFNGRFVPDGFYLGSS